MLRLIPKVVLLVALLTTLVVSSVPVFAGTSKTCQCVSLSHQKEGCQFDQKTVQCVNTSCRGLCFLF
jgi:hypothetical protein